MKIKGVFLLVILWMCMPAIQAAVVVTGNGNMVTQQKDIPDFNQIRVDVLCDLIYVQSDDEPSIEVTLDENLFPFLQWEVKDRILHVSFKGARVDSLTQFTVKTHSKWLKEARVGGNANFMIENELNGDELVIRGSANSLIQLKNKVKMGKIDLRVTNSANMIAKELETEKLSCSITGTGTIRIHGGTAQTANYSITNSGMIHAFDLIAPEVSCKVTGTGAAEVQATQMLKASMVGNGSIRYKGGAALNTSKIGKGSIEKVD